MMKLDPRKPIPPKIEEAVANVINMKMKNSSLPNNSIQLNTGGSQPLTLTLISVARVYIMRVLPTQLCSY